MTLPYFLLILFGVALNAGAQILLKVGMNRIGHFDFVWANMMPIGWQVATSLPIFMGLVLYFVSVLVWLVVLSRIEVSVAYPMVSIGYVMASIAAWQMFGEALSPQRMLGIGVIIFGVWLVSRTA